MPLHDLSEPMLSLLLRLAAAPLAWQSPAQLSKLAGADLDATLDVIADLDLVGFLSSWEFGSTVYVTLSPLGAERLGVRLVPVGRSEAMRWAPRGDPEPPSPEPPGRIPSGRARLDLLHDPSPCPMACAIASEASSKAARLIAADPDGDESRLDALPRPTILLGMMLTPWPGPGADLRAACPGCEGRDLPQTTYCVVCDRWGLDHLLRTRPRRAATAALPCSNASRVGNGPLCDARGLTKLAPCKESVAAKAARKAKHARKLAEAADRERGVLASRRK